MNQKPEAQSAYTRARSQLLYSEKIDGQEFSPYSRTLIPSNRQKFARKNDEDYSHKYRRHGLQTARVKVKFIHANVSSHKDLFGAGKGSR